MAVRGRSPDTSARQSQRNPKDFIPSEAADAPATRLGPHRRKRVTDRFHVAFPSFTLEWGRQKILGPMGSKQPNCQESNRFNRLTWKCLAVVSELRPGSLGKVPMQHGQATVRT